MQWRKKVLVLTTFVGQQILHFLSNEGFLILHGIKNLMNAALKLTTVFHQLIIEQSVSRLPSKSYLFVNFHMQACLLLP